MTTPAEYLAAAEEAAAAGDRRRATELKMSAHTVRQRHTDPHGRYVDPTPAEPEAGSDEAIVAGYSRELAADEAAGNEGRAEALRSVLERYQNVDTAGAGGAPSSSGTSARGADQGPRTPPPSTSSVDHAIATAEASNDWTTARRLKLSAFAHQVVHGYPLERF